MIPFSIYRIDPRTANSTLVGRIPVLPFLGAGAADGAIYIGKSNAGGFLAPAEIWKFNSSNGAVLSRITLDPALDAYNVFGMVAVPVPEPATGRIAGVLAIGFVLRTVARRRS